MRLADLQRQFSRFLLEGSAEGLIPAIRSDWFSPEERLSIYKNNFLISLTEALLASFPVTAAMLGSDFTRQLASKFITAYPPRSPRLVEYGGDFAPFLRTQPELSNFPYVPEMAEFEWLRVRAWDATQQDCLTAEKLGSLSPEQQMALLVRLSEHVGVLDHFYPVLQLWLEHQSPEPRLEGIDMSPSAGHSLIYRAHGKIHDRAITVKQANFLKSLVRSFPLGKAIDAAFPENADEAAEIIQLALQNGILVVA